MSSININQITASGGKFTIFLVRAWTKIPLRIYQNTTLQWKNLFFRAGDLAPLPRPLSPRGEGTASRPKLSFI